jgi:phytoene desaturase
MLTLDAPPRIDATAAEAGPARDARAHAVVIGSGFGGLAAAVRLGARGYRVTVLERLDAPGGRAYVHEIDGFRFDAGPTIITLPQLFEELWALCGRTLSDDVDLRPLDPFYVLRFDDGESFTCSGDEAAMRREVERLSPKDLPGYERFMRESAGVYRFAFEKLGQKPFSKFSLMLEALPGFVRHQAQLSAYGYVSQFMKDERLRVAFSFHPLFIGGDPFAACSLYTLVSHIERAYGVHFAMGGTGALVRGLQKLIEEQGGVLRFNADVAEILVEKGRARGVRLASGERIDADIVVSNADSAATYGRLLAHAPRKRWTDRRLSDARYSMGLFVWYFGVNRRYETVDHHTILLGPRYRELLKDIFTAKRLAADFSLYLHRPTATDPSLAPPGCDAFYALSPVPHLDAGVDWTAAAEPYRRAIERRLEETVLPGLKDAVVVSHVATPLDFLQRLDSPKGAAFGLEPVLLQSAWFRPHNRSEEAAGLYLVGAGTHPGAGVPGVLSSARILDQIVPDPAVARTHAS